MMSIDQCLNVRLLIKKEEVEIREEGTRMIETWSLALLDPYEFCDGDDDDAC